jgi:hypothetical protein
MGWRRPWWIASGIAAGWVSQEPVLEALKDAINQRRLNVDELWRQAQVQRMQRVMTPYLEALL